MASKKDTIAHLLGLMEAQGLTVEDLAAAAEGAAPSTSVPTVRDYLSTVEKATTDGAAKTYRTYWNKLVESLGDRRLDEVKVSDLRAVALNAAESAVVRSNHRNGISAQENCVGALRAFFELAAKDGHVASNVALDVKKPKRQPSRRRPLTEAELTELYELCAQGDDPALDTLLFRFHLETGARRGGAIALRVRDLDAVRQCVRLREKGKTERWQPVSKTLLDALRAHARDRGATAPNDAVLRQLPPKGMDVGKPLTRRRYNTVSKRWQSAHQWAEESGVSFHWLRHTALATVERLSGSVAVAREFAGHHEKEDVTLSYIKASISEVATAVAQMTGEPHPLASSEDAV